MDVTLEKGERGAWRVECPEQCLVSTGAGERTKHWQAARMKEEDASSAKSVTRLALQSRLTDGELAGGIAKARH